MASDTEFKVQMLPPRPQTSNAPLPWEMPKGNASQDLTPQAQKSTAVQHLIHQNEDLMARLSVAIKKLQEFEDFNAIANEKNEVLQAKVQSFRDQILIFREKDSALAARQTTYENEIRSSQDRIEVLEFKYAELYTANKDLKRESQCQIQKLNKLVSRYQKYRAKIRDLSAALKISLKQKATELVELNRGKIEDQRSKELLKQRLNDLQTHLQSLHSEASLKISSLQSHYEKQIESLKLKAIDSEKEMVQLRQRVIEFDRLNSENIRYKNLNIELGRNLEQSKSNHLQDLEELRNQISTLRTENTSHKEALYRTHEQLKQTESEIKGMTVDLAAKKDHLESLQIGHLELHKELEKEREKIRALQSLNQQLSRSLTERRKSEMESQKRAQDNWVQRR